MNKNQSGCLLAVDFAEKVHVFIILWLHGLIWYFEKGECCKFETCFMPMLVYGYAVLLFCNSQLWMEMYVYSIYNGLLTDRKIWKKIFSLLSNSLHVLCRLVFFRGSFWTWIPAIRSMRWDSSHRVLLRPDFHSSFTLVPDRSTSSTTALQHSHWVFVWTQSIKRGGWTK